MLDSLWSMVNKLSLNIKKTHYMIFTKKKLFDSNINFTIDGQAVD